MNLLKIFISLFVKDEASDKLDSVSEKVGKGLKTAAKVGGAAVAAAATAVAALTKQSVQQFAEYEQLVGGVDTLFKSSGQQVLQFAKDAYKTAGMSANEYMNTITGFAASMKQSFDDSEAGIAAAAEASNQAVIDMADNANKMGTDIASIQNAYQGFAKQNYTMLDNLKLGYGGTKEEMERLLEDANRINAEQGIMTQYSIDNFADVTAAIHTVQTSLGITGTTAKEASTTISGSLGMVKAAWTNLLTGMSGGTEEFALNQEELMQNMIDSLVGFTDEAGNHVNGFLDNIVPVISATLDGIIELIGGASGFLPQILNVVIEAIPKLIDAGMNILLALMQGIMSNIGTISETVTTVIQNLINFLTEHLEEIITMGIEILLQLVIGIIRALPDLIATVPQIVATFVSAIINALPSIAQAGLELLSSLVQGVYSGMSGLVNGLSSIVQTIRNFIGGLGGEAWSWGSDLIVNFINGITAWLGELWNRVAGIAQGIRNYIGFSEPKLGPLSNFHTYAPDMMKLFAEGITDNADLISDAFNSSVDIGVGNMPNMQQTTSNGVLGSIGDIVLNVTSEIDGEALARSTYKYNVAEQKRHGVSYA